MLDIVATAEIKKINTRTEYHGEDEVRAMDVKLAMQGVPIERLTSAIPEGEAMYYNGDMPRGQEVFPLKVRHKIKNVKCTLSADKKETDFKDCDVDKFQITPQQNKLCNVVLTLNISGYADRVLDRLTKWHEVHFTAKERQGNLDLAVDNTA